MAEAGGDLAAAGMAKGRGPRPVPACTIRSLPTRGSAGHPSGLLHAHGSSNSLPACLPGRQRPRQRQQGACLPARGSGGSSSQPTARQGPAAVLAPAMAAAADCARESSASKSMQK